ncbi:hypothetical protein [Paracoccus tibetensis]|uniref:Exopolysaccharide production protein ExoF n=1 Tax=Paracoccus tibetensis TaxID=336292 RepID=A0A1G5DCI8_9RHOB|nr:hypothetical protein [Paracoccus tibetensis]SCY12130.1 hypothetical protein SAMN05660710_00745 [Paracoccus tibetensis]
MSSDKSGFLVSAAIVAVGIGGLWAFPTLQEDGLQGALARLSALAGRGGAVTVPDGSAGVPRPDPASIAESPVPGHGAADPSILVAARAPEIGSLCDRRASDDLAVVGDRVQLRFFERSAMAAATGPAGPLPASEIVFERLDLSGLYDIDAAGAASLPAIGHVELAGRGLACIEAIIARAAYDRMGAQTSVTAAFAARPPVLVRGAVRAPGSYGHSPGLTVERVLAQAGLLDGRDPASQARLIALEARRTELERTRAALALERMRVAAMLAGQRTLRDDPLRPEVLRLLGADRLAAEERVLVQMLDAEDRRADTAREAIADLSERIDIAGRQQSLARQQVVQYNARLAQQSQRLRNLQVRDLRLEETTMRAVDSERILLEKQDLLLRLQAERRQAQLDAALSAGARERDLTLELRRIDAAIASAATELQAIAAEERLLGQDAAALEVTIARAGGSPVAAETSAPVRPGDLVTVTLATPPAPDDLSALPKPSSPIALPHDNQSAWIR